MGASLEKIETLFHEALALPFSERQRFLETACANDLDLLFEVESLLAHEGDETAAFEVATRRVASNMVHAQRLGSSLHSGTMLGPYVINSKLGEGGMGTVYLATDSRLQRDVAIKVVNGVFTQNADAGARFLREARAAAALSHANIAAVYDFGQTEEITWLVMEYVKGRSLLASVIEPLGATVWIRYATQIAAALAHAHSRGLIHRDIKPQNILITTDDQIKIIDFGLARAIREQLSAANAITAQGTFIGTLAYSAPEVLRGGAASFRSDIYSLGVVLYEMACGTQPFSGLHGHDLIAAVLMGTFPACRISNPQIPVSLQEIIEGCMSREPAARYKDASTVLSALLTIGTIDTYSKPDSVRPIIAVMDFTNVGGKTDLDWLGTGMAETLSADLAKLKSVRIAGRSRVLQTLRRLGDPTDQGIALDLGRALDARWVVTGSYQQIGERIRFTATLTETGNGEVTVAGKIDGLRTHLFEAQDRVVVAILDALTIQVDTAEQYNILRPETRHLAAYEHYVRGRQRLSQMQETSLSAAIRHFEQAITLDPDYALAYSGLGTAHGLQFIATSNPEDIKQASNYLERAIELDSELGEPYPWLAFIRVRKNDPNGAFLAGRKGVELQPDLAEAHYFYAGARYMLPDFEPGAIRETPQHFTEAIRLQPRFHAAWVIFGASATFLGCHGEAIRLLKEAVRLEDEPDLLFRFVGARTLLAMALTRAGFWDEARAEHLLALDDLKCIDHVYATTFEALSACGLGDIEIRLGDARIALTHYRRARRIIQESRRILGAARLSIRVDAGLATAYAVVGNTSRACSLAAKAALELESLGALTAGTTFECSIPQLWLLLAVAEVRIGDVLRATNHLDRARSTGWLDVQWLKKDPELRPLHNHAIFLSFIKALSAAPEVMITMPSSIEAAL